MAILLDSVLAWPNLCDAWERVADNRGAPGPDGISIRRFARHWEVNLRRLTVLVQNGGYRPGRLRRVAISKPSGGQRLLSIPNVGDRVLQRAVLNVLEPLYERRFLACSYGYRPRRSLHNAVTAILGYRDQGLTWVLDADIDECFDSLDHETMRGFLGKDVQDSGVMNLLALWLANGRRFRHPDRGIAQGMPISPLLCNVYLHSLDQSLTRRRWALVRYADDFIVCCRSQSEVDSVQALVEDVLGNLRLRLDPKKTAITSFDQGFDFLGVHFEADSYSFTWEDKRFRIQGPTPRWLWGYVPDGYV